MIAAVRNCFKNYLGKSRRYAGFQVLQNSGLPSELIAPLLFLIDGSTIPADVKSIAARIEGIRASIRNRGSETIDIFYSPKPGSSASVESRPSPGSRKQFTMEQIARTGKDRRWGIFLHLCARSAKASTILELGSCAGLSGSYLASAPQCREFVTVEGSKQLAALADQSLKQVVNNARVVNDLFDPALDKLLPELAPIDLAFIDGHHEKVATIHYFERIRPRLRDRAFVIFDDISWSQDMRDCWNLLMEMGCFSHVVDCGVVGVCVFDQNSDSLPVRWDMQKILGRQGIGDPLGWKD